MCRTATVKDLRWWIFKKKQAQSEKLPPTQAALEQTVMRANYQAMVWNNDIVPQPQLPSPDNFGWKLEDNKWLPVMTTLPPAPEAVIQLVKCSCAKEKCSTNRCQCRKANLNCTDLCNCCDSGDICENSHSPNDDLEEDEDVANESDDSSG